jgi:drug/metabolite transporter (DMT)-like permease
MTTRTIGLANTFLMTILIVIWGSSFVVVKILLREGLTPVAVATFRFLIAGGLFFVALLLKRKATAHSRLLVEKKEIAILWLLALSGVTFFFIAQYTGIQMAGAATAAIFVCLLSPIIISVASTALLKEHLKRRQILGIGIAATGTFTVIAGGGLSYQSGRELFIGSLVLLLTPLLWTVYTVVGKRMMRKYDPFLIVGYVSILGGLSLIPFSLAEGSLQQILTLSPHSWFAILFLALGCSLLGYYIWFHAVRHIGAAVTSSFLFVEPLVTALLAVTVVGEALTIYILVGGLLILAGVYLVTKK